jgi:threonine synthase
MRVFVFMPVDTPILNQKECAVYGAEVVLVRGLIDDCAAIVRRRAASEGWFDVSTLKEPYRAEGKKTMGLEIAEQLGWELPDVIVYPTGGGTGIVGMWKAFEELETLGFIGSSAASTRLRAGKMPRRARAVCVCPAPSPTISF